MAEPWLERWQEGRTGWHEPQGNASLKKYWRASGRRVLVPLCGKSADLKWLADQGNEVIGVELSELAIKAFFEEHALDYVVQDGELRCFIANDASIRVFCGDFFELQSLQCDAHYDRAALVAMPAELRPSYAAHAATLLTAGAEQLIITLEYDQAIANGPPFSVMPTEIRNYWPHLECLDAYDDLANAPPKFAVAGLTQLVEKVWRSP